MTRTTMTMVTLSSALVLGAALAGCGDDFEPPRALTPQEQALVQASNAFGFDFFAEVLAQQPDENVFVSPLSVSMALGMTYNGARGTTAEGMAGALAYGDLTLAEVNQSYRSLIDLLTGMDPTVTLEIANSIWYRQGLPVLQAFTDACKRFFSAAVTALDFNDPGAADTINAWVKKATHDKIDEIVDGIDALSMMFLVNAVYFKGDWATQFDADETTSGTFHGRHADASVSMMHLKTEVDYLDTETFQLVHLPYGHGLFGMTVILPHQGESVETVAATLGGAAFTDWLSRTGSVELDVYLPRFELEYEATLNDVLIALGMDQAFDANAADFGGMVEAVALYISEVKHKSYVKVNEQGTEAAAVTSVEMRVGAIMDELRVDRPFLFAIHDQHSQSMIFMGRVLDL